MQMLNYTFQCKNGDKCVFLYLIVHFYTFYIAYYADEHYICFTIYKNMHIHYYILLYLLLYAK